MKIPFNRQPILETSVEYIIESLNNQSSGDGKFTKKCSEWLEAKVDVSRALLTTSGSHALDMSAILCNVCHGDEVIMPSFTFSSTANAFVGRGAKVVFIDIKPDTMNLDENLIEDAITAKTRVIVPMHYAGVSCEMDKINEIAKKYNLFVVEDAAHGIMSEYKGIPLGALGDFGCFSFHETKNFSMGEGGALLITHKNNILEAEIMREKGTNRSQFFRGEVDKYSWIDWGSSYLPSELNAAYLWSQLEVADKITETRLKIWEQYYAELTPLAEKGYIELPYVPHYCKHNAHMFYFKVSDSSTQMNLIHYLKSEGIYAVFHYVPLHSAKAGVKYGRFHGVDKFTTKESERLIRLPMYYALNEDEVSTIVRNINRFFTTREVN